MSCKRSCMSNIAGSVIHSKIYTFSKVGRTPYVTMISSANPHDVNTTVSWNNTAHHRRQQRMYDSVRGYFIDMTKDRNNLDYYNTRKPLTSGKYAIFYYPRAPRRGVPDRRHAARPQQRLLPHRWRLRQRRSHGGPDRHVGLDQPPDGRRQAGLAAQERAAARST